MNMRQFQMFRKRPPPTPRDIFLTSVRYSREKLDVHSSVQRAPVRKNLFLLTVVATCSSFFTLPSSLTIFQGRGRTTLVSKGNFNTFLLKQYLAFVIFYHLKYVSQ